MSTYQMCKTPGCNRVSEADSDICFRCRVKTVGFSFVGGGGYTRESFHERTTAEFLRENVGGDERELAKRTDVAKADP